MFYSTDPGIRERFIAALRQVADYLATHPAMPVPRFGEDITLHAASTGDGGTAQVDHLARLLGARISDDRASSGHYTATREFGPLTVRVVAISDAQMARRHAHLSYDGCVTPDGLS